MEEKKEWTQPTVEDFDVAERTDNNPGDGPDGAFGEPGEGGGGGDS